MRASSILAAIAGLSIPVTAWAQATCAPTAIAPTAIEGGTLTVKGTASVDRRPDTAHLAVTVRTRGPSLDGTARDHEARVNAAAGVLDRLKADSVSVDTGDFSLNEERAPVPPGGRPSDVPPTYRAETRYDLTMPLDPKLAAKATAEPGPERVARLDAVVAAVASSGLFELGQVRFSVSDDASAIDDVRRAAVADAKRQAQIYAEGTEMRLDGVDRIVDGAADAPGDGVFDLPIRSAAAALPRPSVGIKAPKSMSFSGSVTVVWHIVPR